MNQNRGATTEKEPVPDGNFVGFLIVQSPRVSANLADADGHLFSQYKLMFLQDLQDFVRSFVRWSPVSVPP